MRALGFDEFDGRDGDTFELLLGDGALSFTLTKTQALPPSGREGGAFTLDWLGPYEPLLPQSIYTFRDGDRQFEMFIVPIGRDPDGSRYEAVFN